MKFHDVSMFAGKVLKYSNVSNQLDTELSLSGFQILKNHKYLTGLNTYK